MNEKEREEFAIMKNEITHIKTNVQDIKGMLKDHVEWESKKNGELDAKYLHKSEFEVWKDQIEKENAIQDKDIRWNKERLFDLGLKVASLLAIVGFGAKAIGVF